MPVWVNLHNEHSDLSRLVAQPESGEEVIIMRDGRPVARLVLIHQERIPGLGDGNVRISPDFDEPLPEDTLQTFEPS